MAILKLSLATPSVGSPSFERSRTILLRISNTNEVGFPVSMRLTNFGYFMVSGIASGDRFVRSHLAARDLIPPMFFDSRRTVARALAHTLIGGTSPLSSFKRYPTQMNPFGGTTADIYQPSNSYRRPNDEYRRRINSRLQSVTPLAIRPWVQPVSRQPEPAAPRRLGSRRLLRGMTCLR